MTERARKASEQRTRAKTAWVAAEAAAGRIGPRFTQTEETMSRYKRAQKLLDEAELALAEATHAVAQIPSEEYV